MRVLPIRCGSSLGPMAVCDPTDDEPGKLIRTPFYVYAIDHPQGWVVFDTGISQRYRDIPSPGPYSFSIEAEDRVDRKLESLSISPADVHTVVMSHLHFDHAGGLDCLPGAEVAVTEVELNFAQAPAVYQRGIYDPQDFGAVERWRIVEDGTDLFGDGLLRIVSTPGHTPGHLSLVAELESGPCVLGGDATYLRAKMDERRLPGIVWSPDEMVKSWERLEELERDGARLLFTHEPDQPDVSSGDDALV